MAGKKSAFGEGRVKHHSELHSSNNLALKMAENQKMPSNFLPNMEKMREKLMERDKSTQVEALKEILVNVSGHQRINHSHFLCDDNFGRILCSLIKDAGESIVNFYCSPRSPDPLLGMVPDQPIVPNEQIVSLISKIFRNFSTSEEFYNNNLAREAVHAMIYIINDSPGNNLIQHSPNIVTDLVIAILKIVDKAVTLALPMNEYFERYKLFNYLHVIELLPTDPTILVLFIRCLTSILKYSKPSIRTLRLVNEILETVKVHLLRFIPGKKDPDKRKPQRKDRVKTQPILYLGVTFVCCCELGVELFKSDLPKSLIQRMHETIIDFLIHGLIMHWHVLSGIRDKVANPPYLTNLEPLTDLISIVWEHNILPISHLNKYYLMNRLRSSGCAAFMLENSVSADRVKIISILSTVFTYWTSKGTIEAEEFANCQEYFIENLMDDANRNFRPPHSFAYHAFLVFLYPRKTKKQRLSLRMSTDKAPQLPPASFISKPSLMVVLRHFLESHASRFFSDSEQLKGVPTVVSTLLTSMPDEEVAAIVVSHPVVVALFFLNSNDEAQKRKIVQVLLSKRTDIQILSLETPDTHSQIVLWDISMKTPELYEEIQSSLEEGFRQGYQWIIRIGRMKVADPRWQQNMSRVMSNFAYILQEFNAGNIPARRFITIIELLVERYPALELPLTFTSDCADNLRKIILRHLSNKMIRRPILSFLKLLLFFCRKRSDFMTVKVFTEDPKFFMNLYTNFASGSREANRLVDIFVIVMDMQIERGDLQNQVPIEIRQDLVVSLKSQRITMDIRGVRFWERLFQHCAEKSMFSLCVRDEDDLIKIADYVVTHVIIFLRRLSRRNAIPGKSWTCKENEQRQKIYSASNDARKDAENAIVCPPTCLMKKGKKNLMMKEGYRCLLAIFRYGIVGDRQMLLRWLCDLPALIDFVDERIYRDSIYREHKMLISVWFELNRRIPTGRFRKFVIDQRNGKLLRTKRKELSSYDRVIMDVSCMELPEWATVFETLVENTLS